jgi:hypothetical protein
MKKLPAQVLKARQRERQTFERRILKALREASIHNTEDGGPDIGRNMRRRLAMLELERRDCK